MSTTPTLTNIADSADDLIEADLFDEANAFAAASLSVNTRRTYASRWKMFCAWCAETERTPMPCTPGTVVSFITHLSRDHKVSTISQCLTVIRVAHRLMEEANPTTDNRVRAVWQGIRRSLGVAQKRAGALEIDELRLMLRHIPRHTPRGARDAAILLLGVAGALRRSEIVALDFDDLDFVDEGIVVRVRRSKTDQEGAGEFVGIPVSISAEICPVRAMGHWLGYLQKNPDLERGGPIFFSFRKGGKIQSRRLGDRAVSDLVKRIALDAGLDPKKYSGHTLRATLATAASAAGAPVQDIKRHGRWRSSEIVFRYVRPQELFRQNPAARALR